MAMSCTRSNALTSGIGARRTREGLLVWVSSVGDKAGITGVETAGANTCDKASPDEIADTISKLLAGGETGGREGECWGAARRSTASRRVCAPAARGAELHLRNGTDVDGRRRR